MVCGKDFFVGYSPERINPGDEEHDLPHIFKIVAGHGRGDARCALRPLRPGHQRLPCPRHPDGRGREGDRERPARPQHRAHERALHDLRTARPRHRTRCSRPRAPSGTSTPTAPGSSAATASPSTPITSCRRPRRSGTTRR